MRSKPMMLISLISFLIICYVCLSGFTDTVRSGTATVIKEDQYGGLVLDLNEIDLEYGDSVNLSFSGGYEIEDIPFYPDYYGNKGSVILTDHFDTLRAAGVGCSFNNDAEIKIGEDVTISLEQKGRYKKEYEAYNTNDARLRMEGQSDEAFRNAREVTAGQIQEQRLYRGATPFDQKYGRVELMDRYIQDNHIQCVLDLCDTREKLETYENLLDYAASLISNDQVILCGIGVDYLDPEVMQTLGRGLAEMTEKDGPYLIHCSLGRDRTGVVCAVLEALCGATYQEIVEDYMTSFDMLHTIDMDPESFQYQLFKQRIDEELEAILGISIAQLPVSDLQTPAFGYLIRCGMTEEQVEKLKDRLTSPASAFGQLAA